MISGKEWREFDCTETKPFICQFPAAQQMTGKTNTTLTYTLEELSFSSFVVWYTYSFNQGLLDSWQDKRMTGL